LFRSPNAAKFSHRLGNKAKPTPNWLISGARPKMSVGNPPIAQVHGK
jgi:hypothetical protein